MCGEHLDAGSEQKPCPGSSPHVRGALLRLLIAATIGGIIPACAGSTQYGSPMPSKIRDHPRMCGEHIVKLFAQFVHMGSSPHVRGALFSPFRGFAFAGIIPACAGSTPWRRTAQPPHRDHPRMCGEHLRKLSAPRYSAGSSPHVRGALRCRFQRLNTLGIIPACAGSTTRPSAMTVPPRDHPRMCGEHHGLYYSYVDKWGSSPHVRGAPASV